MTTNSPTLASTVVYCSVPDHRETQAITSLVATQYAFQLLELAALPNCDAATVADLQAYLLCRQLGCPIPPRLNRLWETFFGRCESLVRRIIEQFCSRMQLSVEIDDLSQEVWHEIVEQLPKLVYDPTRGRLGDWFRASAHFGQNGLARQRGLCENLSCDKTPHERIPNNDHR